MRDFDDDNETGDLDGDGIVKTVDFGSPMDFNDPKSIEPALAVAAQDMLRSNVEEIQVAGLAMKYMGPAFAAYMADCQRQDYDKAATLTGLCQNFASILSMLTCAASDREDEVKQTTATISKHFLETYIRMVCMNRNTEVKNNSSARRSEHAGEATEPHHFTHGTRRRTVH